MNLNNIEFEFMISGECRMRRVHNIEHGREVFHVDIDDVSSIIAYQTWSSDAILKNNVKAGRVVFSIMPDKFHDIVKNYNSNNPDGKYKPTCVIKTDNEVMYLKILSIHLKGASSMSSDTDNDLSCLCDSTSGNTFINTGLTLVADHDFTHLDKNIDGERLSLRAFLNETEEIENEKIFNANINLSALPYSDIDYNLLDREHHPFKLLHKKSAHFTVPSKKNTNRYSHLSYRSIHHTISKKSIELPPERQFSFIINDHVFIKKDIFGTFIEIENPKMITAYQDWSKETKTFNTKRYLKNITAGQFAADFSQINHYLTHNNNGHYKHYKFTPTVYLDVNYGNGKRIKTLSVIKDVRYVMNTKREGNKYYSTNVKPRLILRLNQTLMKYQDGTYLTQLDISKDVKVHMFANIDDTPNTQFTDDNKGISSINNTDLRSIYLNKGLINYSILTRFGFVNPALNLQLGSYFFAF